MDYEWDETKAKANIQKHGIDFADAVGVFEDEWALTIEDEKIDLEQRFITLGLDFLGRVLTVVYTYRENTIRIISARKAAKKEELNYEARRR
jgi:uncharacterized protein